MIMEPGQMRTNIDKIKVGNVRCNVLLGLLTIIALLLVACNATTLSIQSPTTTPRADDLSETQAATLSSLKKIDDHPLYTMRYVGAYDTRASLTEPWIASLPSPLATPAWACSLFAALGDASNMFYGRNFDWEHSPAVLLFTEPPNGYASVSMVDIAYLGFNGTHADNLTELVLVERRALLRAPFLPFDGMNARGLTIGMAAVPDGQMKNDPSKPTIDLLMIIRKILDSAANVDEAIALFQQYNISMDGGPPLHYLVADQTGRAALIELFQGKMIVIPNEDKSLQATNFLQSSIDNPVGQCWRRDTIAQRLAQTGGRVNARDAMQLLRDVSQRNTEWSIVYGMTTGEIDVTMGRQYNSPHRFTLALTR
ncbi:hypothetical protein ANRL1_04691 [Anaerolineae bacterium]|nr:hypothetical protein ANRL1_04691 [Anaerolineae bacterium]